MNTSKRNMLLILLVLFMLLNTNLYGATVAYWQLDADDPTKAVDAVGDYDLLAVGDPAVSALKINPIPNPDTTLPWKTVSDAATNEAATYFSSDAYHLPIDDDSVLDVFRLTTGQSFTIEGWFRAKGSGQVVTARHGGASHQKGGNYKGWAVYTTASGGSLTFYCNGASSNSESVVLSAPITVDQLTHFAAVYDASAGDSGETYIYIDGKLEATGDVPSSWGFTRGGALAIGARDTGTGFNNSFFPGAIDEIRYSDEALAPEQFLNYVYVPDTIAYWEFDGFDEGTIWDDFDGDGSNERIIPDAVGNYSLVSKNHALISNSTLKADIINPDASVWQIEGHTSADNLAASYFSSDSYYVPNLGTAIEPNEPNVPGSTPEHDPTFDFVPGQSFTVDGWARANNSGYIIGNRHTASAAHQFGGSFKGWFVSAAGGGTSLTFRVDGDATATASAPIVKNALFFFAAVYDADSDLGESGELRLYINSELASKVPVPAMAEGNYGGALAVGARDRYATGFDHMMLNGAIDELRISSVALEQERHLGYIPSKKSYWEFDGADWDGSDAVGNADLTVATSAGTSTMRFDPVPVPDDTVPWNGTDDAATNIASSYFSGGAAYYYDPNQTGERDGTFDFSPGKSFTVEGWLTRKVDSTGWIIGNRTGDSAFSVGGNWDGWDVRFSGGALKFYITEGGDAVTVEIPIEIDRLFHFAAIWNALTKKMELYVNGKLEASAPGNSEWSGVCGGPLSIGARDATDDGIFNFDSWQFSGRLDEVRFIDKVLAPVEFLSGIVPECGDLGFYKVDFNQDCIVNLADFAELAAVWLQPIE